MKILLRLIHFVIRFLTDTLFPESCLVCDRTPHHVHQQCIRNLPHTMIGIPLEPWVFPTLAYSDRRTQTLVRYLKNNSDIIQIDICARHMIEYHHETLQEALELYEIKKILVISIPSNTYRKKNYDFNQSELLARSLSQHIHNAIFSPQVLYRMRDTKKQALCNKEERLQNMKNVMGVIQPDFVRDSICILVDDVTTTGATLADARRALIACGARHVVALTLAH